MAESLHGLTKGTELEPLMAAMAQGEANGTMMYYALARLAAEQGLDDAAKVFIESGESRGSSRGLLCHAQRSLPERFLAIRRGRRQSRVQGRGERQSFG